MKYIDYYKEKGVPKEEAFDFFIKNLRASIKVWEYFVNWEKADKNLANVVDELNLLNGLLDSEDLEKDFKEKIKKYPNVVKALPILLAIRDNRLQIVKDYKNENLEYLTFDFELHDKISDEEAELYFSFIKQSGLTALFCNSKIKNLIDYVFGVEVGLDSNGRKNRGGKLMEDIVEVFIAKLVNSENSKLEYMAQASPLKINKKWGYEVKFEKSARNFDFAIYNKESRKIYLIETNFFEGGGTKLKAVCGEFKGLYHELKNQNIDLIWITDGSGWLTTKRPLEETFNEIDHIFNLKMIQDGVMQKLYI